MEENDTLKAGVNWNYLNTILYLQEDLFNKYKKFVNALQRKRGISSSTKELIASLSSFYLSVQGQFNIFLKREKKEDFKNKFQGLPLVKEMNAKNLLDLVNMIMEWNQNQGYFKTVNERVHPSNSWAKG